MKRLYRGIGNLILWLMVGALAHPTWAESKTPNAGPYFVCYPLPTYKLQVFQYSTECGGQGHRPDPGRLVGGPTAGNSVDDKDMKDVLCMYVAACKPVPTDPGGKVKVITDDEFKAQYTSGDLKASLVTCKGKALIKDAKIDLSSMATSDCANATKCAGGVYYDMILKEENPTATFYAPTITKPTGPAGKVFQ